MTVAYRDYPLTGREFLFRRNAFSNTLITDCVQCIGVLAPSFTPLVNCPPGALFGLGFALGWWRWAGTRHVPPAAGPGMVAWAAGSLLGACWRQAVAGGSAAGGGRVRRMRVRRLQDQRLSQTVRSRCRRRPRGSAPPRSPRNWGALHGRQRPGHAQRCVRRPRCLQGLRPARADFFRRLPPAAMSRAGAAGMYQ